MRVCEILIIVIMFYIWNIYFIFVDKNVLKFIIFRKM